MKSFLSLKSTTSLISCAALSLSFVGCGSGDKKVSNTVTNDLGTFQGVKEIEYTAFKGIRYAAAPEGDLRWKAPTAPAELTETYMADEFGSACPQAGGTYSVSNNNEDCLYLNVFTSDLDGEHPVMVWIHGGAFVSGSGSGIDPSRLIDEGIVVVSLNYRLGALGFLAHPELTAETGSGSGNYGLMDQQLALKWVQDNIKDFGGDPDNVTIFGESAGGHSVTSQLVATGRTGLFHKAIIHSGNYNLGQQSQTNAEDLGNNADFFAAGTGYASAAGCTTDGSDLTCLRNKTVEELLTAQTGRRYIPTSGTGNDFLPSTAEDAIASGDFADVDIMNGTNLDEGTLFRAIEQISAFEDAITLMNTTIEEATIWEQIQAVAASAEFLNEESEYDATVNILFQFFPHLLNNRTAEAIGDYYLALDQFSSEPNETKFYLAASRMHTDWRFACTASKTSDNFARADRTVYAYHFTDTTAPNILSPFTPIYLGATHAGELQYVILDDAFLNTEQQELSKAMVKYWATFAKTGNPNPNPNNSDLVLWPEYSSQGDNMIELNPTLATTSRAAFNTTHNCDYWNIPNAL